MKFGITVPRFVYAGGDAAIGQEFAALARDADACNLFAMPGEEAHTTLHHKLDVLQQHCEREGREYDSIEKTVIGPFPGTFDHPMAMAPADFAQFVASLEPLGIDTYVTSAVDRNSLLALIEAAEPLRMASATA